MKVAAIKSPGGLKNLNIEDRDVGQPGYGEVLLRVHASSLNYHDLAVVTGFVRAKDGRIPMSDGAGEIIALGEGCQRFAVGDKVVSTFFPDWIAGDCEVAGFQRVPGDGMDGFAAEQVVVAEQGLTAIPQGYSYREAATLPCAALTAWRALFVESELKPGEWLLTQGSGGVSCFALQFAKASGAKVIATSSSDEKLEKLKALGADYTINYKSDAQWGKTARQLADGAGVHAVVEVGGPQTLGQSIEAMRVGGVIAYIGVLTGFAGDVPLGTLMLKNLKIAALTVGSRQQQEAMIRAINANQIKPVLDQDFPIEKIAAAFEHQMSQKHFGKITLSI